MLQCALTARVSGDVCTMLLQSVILSLSGGTQVLLFGPELSCVLLPPAFFSSRWGLRMNIVVRGSLVIWRSGFGRSASASSLSYAGLEPLVEVRLTRCVVLQVAMPSGWQSPHCAEAVLGQEATNSCHRFLVVLMVITVTRTFCGVAT